MPNMNSTEKYLRHITVSGFSQNTVRNRANLFERMNTLKPLEDWSKEDIDNYLYSLTKKNKQWTVSTVKIALKSFFKWLGAPERTDHLDIGVSQNTLERKDILIEADIVALVDATDSPLYKALIWFLFESGARIREVLCIKVSDITETDKGMLIPVYQTKMGKQKRTVWCHYSGQHIRNMITYLGLSHDDYLFKSPRGNKPLSYIAVDKMLDTIKERAGIKKPVNCHSFRHACCTNMLLQGIQEQIIKKALGWSAASDAIVRYQHLIDDDVINARMEKVGELKRPIEPKPELQLAQPIQVANDKAIMHKLVVENEELKTQMKEILQYIRESEAKKQAREAEGGLNDIF